MSRAHYLLYLTVSGDEGFKVKVTDPQEEQGQRYAKMGKEEDKGAWRLNCGG